MTTGMIHEQNKEKHMNKQMGGCMAVFFNLFDRNSLLSGKRVYAKRLPAYSSSTTSSAFDSTTSEPVSTIGSPATLSRELDKPLPAQQSTPSNQSPSPKQPQSTSPSLDSSSSLRTPPPPEKVSFRSPAPQPESPSKSSLSFEFKEGVKSPWKFTREAPRLSLDSRAITDAKGSLHPRDIRMNNKCGGFETATNDDENDRKRSPSVIARLMGLEPPSKEGGGGDARLTMTTAEVEMEKKSQLRRSASESRPRDLLQYRYVDSNNHSYQHVQQNSRAGTNSVTNRDNAVSNYHFRNSIDNSALNIPRKSDAPVEHGGASPLRVNPKSEAMKQRLSSCNNTRPLYQRRSSYYDTADFFPEPKQSANIYGEIERRLKMRGIDEPSKDLETLKQILEALQLKGLLHSKHSEQINHVRQEHQQSRNYVFDRRFSYDESPIVVMKPGKPSLSRRMANDSPQRRNFSLKSALTRRSSTIFSGDALNGSPKRTIEVNRNARSPVRNGRSTSPPLSRPIENRSSRPVGMRRKQQQQQGMLSVEIQRRTNETTQQSMQQGGRVSPVQSPRMRRGVDHQRTTSTTRSRSPRNRRPTVEIYGSEKINGVAEEEASTTISESSFGTSSYTDTERSKMEEHKEGRILLERCDKLLSSIAEMTATSTNELQQPSPVSVLDSSFYKEDSSPSPVMKRTIGFKDHQVVVELEDDQAWSPSSSSANDTDDRPDFTYVSEILRATTHFHHDEGPTASNLFQLLEKQQSLKGKDASEVSKLERKLIFDTITEILGRNQLLPPWKTTETSLEKIWSEFQKIRGEQRDESGSTTEDLLESICGVLKKDLAVGDSLNGWGDSPVEVSEAVLDIERLIYKDLIGETIRDLAEFAGNSSISAPRRKLVF